MFAQSLLPENYEERMREAAKEMEAEKEAVLREGMLKAVIAIIGGVVVYFIVERISR